MHGRIFEREDAVVGIGPAKFLLSTVRLALTCAWGQAAVILLGTPCSHGCHAPLPLFGVYLLSHCLQLPDELLPFVGVDASAGGHLVRQLVMTVLT